jgi:hypothetical protein
MVIDSFFSISTVTLIWLRFCILLPHRAHQPDTSQQNRCAECVPTALQDTRALHHTPQPPPSGSSTPPTSSRRLLHQPHTSLPTDHLNTTQGSCLLRAWQHGVGAWCLAPPLLLLPGWAAAAAWRSLMARRRRRAPGTPTLTQTPWSVVQRLCARSTRRRMQSRQVTLVGARGVRRPSSGQTACVHAHHPPDHIVSNVISMCSYCR